MKGILGRKLGMTQVFTADGNLIPVTVIEVEQGAYDTHEYLNKVKNMFDENFNKEFSRFAQKYSIH